MPHYTSEEAVATDERYILYYRELIFRHLSPDWQAYIRNTPISHWTEDVWTLYDQALKVAAAHALRDLEQRGNGNGSGDINLSYGLRQSATGMKQFLILSTANSPHPWLARKLMLERGIPEGDMMNQSLRAIGDQF
jgi:hypothetical protein